jgi:general secretion pathway protein G
VRSGLARRRAGFTLIELMLTVAILGTLVGIAIPSYRTYVERAKVASAVSDIRNISTEIDGFEADRGRLPADLMEIGYDTWRDPWGNAYAYLPLTGMLGSGGPQPRKDRFLVPINSDYDLYSPGPDMFSLAALTAAQSRDDVVRASNGSFIGSAKHF